MIFRYSFPCGLPLFVLLAMASACASWLDQLRVDLLAKRANERSRWLHGTLDALPVDGRDRVCLLELCRTLELSRYGDGGKQKKPQLIEKLSKTILEQLSMISNYMSCVAGLDVCRFTEFDFSYMVVYCVCVCLLCLSCACVCCVCCLCV